MKKHASSPKTFQIAILFAAALPLSVAAQSMTVSQNVQADTYVSSGQPDNNFGTFGGMEIASPTAAQPRTEESLVRFDTANIQSAFNAAYGAGNWMITGVTLTQYSNFATGGVQPGNSSFNVIAPGGFELDWLSNNSWNETGITWNTLSSVLPGAGANTEASLGDFNWSANGTSPSTWTLSLDPESGE
jgi:hypothetical protein